MLNASTLILLFLSIAFVANAQQTEAPRERPKVGLVLSGGGAKGLAHIGVIKVLEEAGIKPDYIAGTSMGSIIGGLYACGYTPAEMDSIVRAVDWSVVLSDNIPLTDVVPIEKNDYNRFQLEFDINKGELKIPSGVVRGQRISELLSQLTWNVSEVEDFDDLPIPFRCVACDLISGKTHVFKSGDLMTAMRSSMAIPTVFTPVMLDSMYLVDGGVLDNFPVTTAIDMGADIIIGVNVGFKDYPTLEDLNSLPKILMNAASIVSNTSTVDNFVLTDYLISPDLEPFSTSSFFDGIEIISRGEQAARKHFEAFRHLADSLDAIGPYRAKGPPPHKNKIKIEAIEILNRDRISTNYFYSNLGFEPGDSINTDDINMGVRRLIGTRFYKKITYEINQLNGGYKIIFNTEESYPSKAKFSVRYDNELKAGIIANITLRNLLFKNSRLSTTMDISEDPRLSGNLISYIGEDQYIGILNDFYFESTPFPIYIKDAKKYGTFNYLSYQVSLGMVMNIKRSAMLSFKGFWKEVMLKERAGFNDIFDYGINRFGTGFIKTQATLDINTLNQRFFATKGQHFQLSLTGVINGYEIYKGADSARAIVLPLPTVPHKSYVSAMLDWQKHFALTRTLFLSTRLTAGAFSNSAPFCDLFFVGGTAFNATQNSIPFAGLNFREKIIENFGMLRTDLNYQLTKSIYGHIIINGIYAADLGNNDLYGLSILVEQNNYLLGASAGFAINSFLGPVTFGIGTNNYDKKIRGYISIGYPFQ